MLAERPGYQDFQDRKWDALSEVMWAAMVVAIARQDDDLPDVPCDHLSDARDRG